jgi:hypothetical protein
VLLAGKADAELANENGETPLLLLACLTEVPLSTPPAYTLAGTVTALLTCKVPDLSQHTNSLHFDVCESFFVLSELVKIATAAYLTYAIGRHEPQ